MRVVDYKMPKPNYSGKPTDKFDRHGRIVQVGDYVDVYDEQTDCGFRGYVDKALGNWMIREQNGKKHFRWNDYRLEILKGAEACF